jgi:probable HAF family extracellular repeat protein
MNRSLSSLVLSALIALLGASIALGAPSYTITDLGVVGGTTWSEAYAVNDYGMVVGSADVDGYEHAVFWTMGEGSMVMIDIGAEFSAYHSGGAGVSALGAVVGWYQVEVEGGGIYNRAFVWDGVMSELPGLEGYSTGADDINSNGQILGTGVVGIEIHAVLWEGGVLTDLGTLGGEQSYSGGINEAGQMVGSADRADGVRAAFLWEDGVMTELPGLGGTFTYAYDINNSGVVVGQSTNENGLRHAYVYDSGVASDIDGYNGFRSTALAVNNSGAVVGWTQAKLAVSQAFLWEDGAFYDLSTLIDPSLGWSLRRANDINSSGQIVGYGMINGEGHAFMLTPGAPVPAPGALLLALPGLALAALKRSGRARI